MRGKRTFYFLSILLIEFNLNNFFKNKILEIEFDLLVLFASCVIKIFSLEMVAYLLRVNRHFSNYKNHLLFPKGISSDNAANVYKSSNDTPISFRLDLTFVKVTFCSTGKLCLPMSSVSNFFCILEIM